MTRLNKQLVLKLTKGIGLFLLTLLFYILPGIIYSHSFSPIAWRPTSLLFLFIMTNALLENRLRHLTAKKIPLSLILLLLIVIAELVYFARHFSLPIVFNLILFTLLSMSQRLFNNLQLKFIGITLLVWFKIVVMNIIVFYLSTNFISTNLIWLMIPYLLPHLIAHLIHWKDDYLTPLFLSIIASYILSVSLSWSFAGWTSLIQLFSLPTALWLLNKQTGQSARIYTVFFSIIQLILMIQFY